MNQNEKWKILRVLTTNKCNYKCIYCHNEGQEEKSKNKNINLEEFLRYYSIALKAGVEEIRFSGGEPLMNPETLKMIEWLNEHSNVEIGLATNGSFVTEEIAKRLGKTRVMVTLHFPGVGENDYHRVTKWNWKAFENCIDLFDKYNVDYSFNYTLYPETIDAVNEVINYSIDKGKRVKLLPFLDTQFNNFSEKYLEKIIEELNSLENEVQYFSKEGYYLWTFKNSGAVKIIESPCYKKNIQLCKEYGEIRLLPDLSLMNCIFGKPIQTEKLSDDEILDVFYSLFSNMTSCSKVIYIRRKK